MKEPTPLPSPSMRTLPEFIRAPALQVAADSEPPVRGPRSGGAEALRGPAARTVFSCPAPVLGEGAGQHPKAGAGAPAKPARAAAAAAGAAAGAGAAAAPSASVRGKGKAPATAAAASAADATGSGRPGAAQTPAANDQLTALKRRARRALDARHPKDAHKALKALAELSANDADVLALRGYFLHLRGDRAQGQALLDEALSVDSLSGCAHFYQGLLAFERHDLGRAAHHFSEVVVIEPSNGHAARLYRLCRARTRGLRGWLTALARLVYALRARWA